MNKIRVGITSGDINGIGLEVILKALHNETILNQCTPIIYGSSKVVAYHKNIANLGQVNFQTLNDASNPDHGRINVVNCWDETVNINIGKLTKEGGKHAYIALDRAMNDLNAGHIDILVTGPINKKAMQLAEFPFPGHTEYLQYQYKDHGSSLMMMVSGDLKVAIVTGHIPLKEVADSITKERLKKRLKVLISSLKRDFGIEKPTIAVLGLNPHAGDDSALGMEEEEIISPVIIEMKEAGELVSGPYSADGFFGALMHKKFDAILAMYHDQGLIPFKSMAFHDGVNVTAGLPIVRTSPDHGTAFNIAGTNQADPQSMRNAIYLGIDIYRNRKDFDLAHQGVVEKNPKLSEDIVE